MSHTEKFPYLFELNEPMIRCKLHLFCPTAKTDSCHNCSLSLFTVMLYSESFVVDSLVCNDMRIFSAFDNTTINIWAIICYFRVSSRSVPCYGVIILVSFKRAQKIVEMFISNNVLLNLS